MRSNNIFIIHHPKICWNDLWNILKWFLFLQPFIKEGEANFTWIRSIIVTKYYEPFLHEVQPKHGFTPPGNDILSPRSRKNFRWNFCKGNNGQLSNPVVSCWNPLPPTLGRLKVNDPSLKREVRLSFAGSFTERLPDRKPEIGLTQIPELHGLADMESTGKKIIRRIFAQVVELFKVMFLDHLRSHYPLSTLITPFRLSLEQINHKNFLHKHVITLKKITI